MRDGSSQSVVSSAAYEGAYGRAEDDGAEAARAGRGPVRRLA